MRLTVDVRGKGEYGGRREFKLDFTAAGEFRIMARDIDPRVVGCHHTPSSGHMGDDGWSEDILKWEAGEWYETDASSIQRFRWPIGRAKAEKIRDANRCHGCARRRRCELLDGETHMVHVFPTRALRGKCARKIDKKGIDAMELTRDTLSEVFDWMGADRRVTIGPQGLRVESLSGAMCVVEDIKGIYIKTPKGDRLVCWGDFIVQDDNGEFSPHKPMTKATER